MIKYLLLVILLVALTPFAYLAGYGYLNGLDVTSGLSAMIRGLLRNELFLDDPGAVPGELPFEIRETNWLGDIENESLSEASGLWQSRVNEGVLFSINDSGNEPRLFAMSQDGRDRGSWRIDYRDRHDIEDLAGFEHEGVHYLIAADTGDNFYWRPALRLVIFEEPDLEQLDAASTLQVSRIISFRYPDGYRDCEAVAVSDDRIYLVSKRHVPAEVFTLPLFPAGAPHEILVAEPVARLQIPQPVARDEREDPIYGKYRSTPTAMDISGRSAIVMTYKHAYLFRRGLGDTWPEAFSELPVMIPMPDINGLESIALSERGNLVYVTGERDDGSSRMGIYRTRL